MTEVRRMVREQCDDCGGVFYYAVEDRAVAPIRCFECREIEQPEYSGEFADENEEDE